MKLLFNKETLELTVSKETFKTRAKKLIPGIIAGGLFATLAIGVGIQYYDSPETKLLKAKNQQLKKSLLTLDESLNKLEGNMNEIIVLEDSLYRNILGQSRLPASITEAGTGGHTEKSILSNKNLPVEVKNISDKLNAIQARTSVLDQSYLHLIDVAMKKQEDLKHIPSIMPIKISDLSYIGSGYGIRMHPILRIRRMHEGQDFIAAFGTPIHATADGTIKQVYRSATFGKTVIIDHGNGYETFYAHLSEQKVKEGQKVVRGQVIGLMGNTGLSSGTHLHYEVHVNGHDDDPVHYYFNDLTADQYQQVIELNKRDLMSMD